MGKLVVHPSISDLKLVKLVVFPPNIFYVVDMNVIPEADS